MLHAKITTHFVFVQEDLNRISHVSIINKERDNVIHPNLEDGELAKVAWESYMLKNRSIIVDITQGLLRSTLACLMCNHTSTKFDPYMYLSLPLAEDGGELNLATCLSEFGKPEILTGDSRWFCPKCKALRDATKTLKLWNTPPVLIVHLKRFHYDQYGSRRKIQRLVTFPLKSLDLSNNVISSSNRNNLYDVNAVCNHHGHLNGGHYTTFAKKSGTDKWYLFNDSNVREIDSSDVCTDEAYLIFLHTKSLSCNRHRAIINCSVSLSHGPSTVEALEGSGSVEVPIVESWTIAGNRPTPILNCFCRPHNEEDTTIFSLFGSHSHHEEDRQLPNITTGIYLF